MREQPFDGLNLFGRYGNRKYLNAAERRRFIEAAQRARPRVRQFCLTLGYTGGRISEVLALTPASFDIESGVASFCTLKRRKRGMIRQVPLPPHLIDELENVFDLRAAQRDPSLANQRIWRFSRTTAWRYVKAVMAAAWITGTPAMPKGLRHGFCVKAIQSGIPLHLVQRWLGHASLRTTGIYADVIGPDERALAARMWDGGGLARIARRMFGLLQAAKERLRNPKSASLAEGLHFSRCRPSYLPAKSSTPHRDTA
jgi:integrase/recombinase XerD